MDDHFRPPPKDRSRGRVVALGLVAVFWVAPGLANAALGNRWLAAAFLVAAAVTTVNLVRAHRNRPPGPGVSR